MQSHPDTCEYNQHCRKLIAGFLTYLPDAVSNKCCDLNARSFEQNRPCNETSHCHLPHWFCHAGNTEEDLISLLPFEKAKRESQGSRPPAEARAAVSLDDTDSEQFEVAVPQLNDQESDDAGEEEDFEDQEREEFSSSLSEEADAEVPEEEVEEDGITHQVILFCQACSPVYCQHCSSQRKGMPPGQFLKVHAVGNFTLQLAEALSS